MLFRSPLSQKTPRHRDGEFVQAQRHSLILKRSREACLLLMEKKIRTVNKSGSGVSLRQSRSGGAALKSEGRRSKAERRPKPEIRDSPDPMGCCYTALAVDSDFGLRPSFGLRSSAFGFVSARLNPVRFAPRRPIILPSPQPSLDSAFHVRS